MPAYDVIVVGAGHAGCEAAAASARLGARVACVTLKLDHIGRLSCNPAVGGLAKGHLVREIDAMGGLIGRLADAACIQFRRLNTRKGLAVQASRAQVDIDRYPALALTALRAIPTLSLIEAEVAGIRTTGGRVTGVELGDGTVLDAPAVILTTGTFLSGVLHCGDERAEGGRVGDGAAHSLSRSLGELGLTLGRLRTGTTPRLDGRTIAWDRVERQEDTVPNGRFSFRADPTPRLPQVDCFLTWTDESTHEVVRQHADECPLFNGMVKGRGPRYCPSIEVKVLRFPERDRHLIFLEPEGLDSHRVYPNGVSTSLPPDVQVQMMRTIVGLEQVEVLQPGYAVEYDFADPTDLGHDLQHRSVPGLYLAGQVNGTSGYEEAAAQGFVAGVSAVRGEALHIGRDEGYIGVLIDDLVTRGIGGEPYRMFTSRAEHRLLLREDNADRRLMPLGRELGLVSDSDWAAFEGRQEQIALGLHLAETTAIHPSNKTLAALDAHGIGKVSRPSTVQEVLRRPDVSWARLAAALDLPALEPAAAEQVEIDIKYSGYVARAERRAGKTRKMDALKIPPGMDLTQLGGLSAEAIDRLSQAKPSTIGAAARLPGITPAAIDALIAGVGQYRAKAG
ncbi:MAG: tRNA uridine-5-carboxymethylaminomethyl(34) synthesis enzyme MnmG [Myxococcota bacterium]